MKKQFKKIIKLITSRTLYLIIGLFLSISIYTVYANLNNVENGDELTKDLWNNMIKVVNDNEDDIDNLETNKSNKFEIYYKKVEGIKDKKGGAVNCDSGDKILGCFIEAETENTIGDKLIYTERDGNGCKAYTLLSHGAYNIEISCLRVN